MASTYSPSLKIELIGNGDQSGTWGSTTNNNLGTLIEQAITGVQTISMLDANYTLTNYNGTSDEARNAVLVVTGTNTATRQVIAPLVNKMYTVVNNTTGGQAITIGGSSGSTVTVPNGATVLCYCNGTNFYPGISAATNGFIVSAGDVGIGDTTPSYKLDVADTGADIIIRARNTGTSASDDAFLLLQTGGTGTTATISGLFLGDADSSSSGRLYYNHSNDSMTFYTNSTQQAVIQSDGNVGIGTASPTYKLSVAGTGSDHQLWVHNTGTSASDDAIILIQTGGSGTTATISGLYFGDGDSTASGRLNYNHSNDSMVFYTNSTAQLTLSSTGGITIARDTVSSPTSTDGNVFSGYYTPTQVSTNTNVASVTHGTAYYYRVGNMVTVSGQVVVDPTAATSTIVKFSLPISSSFGASRQLGGAGAAISNVYGQGGAAFLADSVNNCAEMRFTAANTSASIWNFSFTYVVA